MSTRILDWLYGRLGRFYPRVFLTLELQTAFIIMAATLGLFSFYYDAVRQDYLALVGIATGLTALNLVVVLKRGFQRMEPMTRWIAGERDRASTAAAWRTAVQLPLDLVRRDLYFPIFGVILPTALAAVLLFDLRPIAFLPLFAGGLLAISYSGVLHYLGLELGMRPILVDINRRIEVPPRIDKPALPLRWKLLASLPLINVITGLTVAAITSKGGGANALGVDVLVALAVSFAISFELTVLLSRSIMRPIEDLEAATERIRQGRFDRHVPVTTADEIGELSSGFNQMVDGLAEREQLREAFGTYLDEEVARHIISEGFEPGGAEVEVSIMFCDVTDFTRAAAESEATEVVARLNELFEVVVPIVARHRGHVDQFIGDGLMAVFGAPERMEDHADRAVQCAVEIARTVNSRRPGGFQVGVGVNSGDVVAGAVGGAGRLSFSVIGDAVNLASRVESHTRELDDQVLITAETRGLLSETIEVESRGTQELKGYANPVELYAPMVPVALRPEDGGDGPAETFGTPEAPALGRAAAGTGDGGKSPGFLS
jgi:adenylate cyclase